MSDHGRDDAPDARAIEEAALAWFALLRDEAASLEQQARFADWLAADPRHRRAWRDVEALWGGLDGLGTELRRLGRARPAARAARRPARPAVRRARRRGLAAAAALLLLLLGGAGGFWALQPPGFAAALFADVRTGQGERRSLVLPDRSTVVLGAASSLSVAYDDSLRRVVLHGGAAFFSVAPDAGYPFVVEAGDGRVTATGTAFEVRAGGGGVAVEVAEGSVAVAPPALAARSRADDLAGALALGAGQGLRYGTAGAGAPYPVAVADVAAWRDDRLVFEATPLGAVLADLERHRAGRILATDPAVAALPVTGVFDTRRPEAALETIERTLPVRLLRLTDLLILVRPAD